MASKQQEELVEKVQKLAERNFGSASMEDMRKLFDQYDRNKDQKIDADELDSLLKDANVGNALTRGAWAKGVMEALDKNSDKAIDWDEFVSAVKT